MAEFFSSPSVSLSTLGFFYTQRIYSQSIKAKLVEFSKVAVSSPVVDISYFLYSSVHPLLISEHYVALLQVQ